MCGRFTLTATPEDVRRLFGHVDRPAFPPREEIRPTEPIGVVVMREGERRFDLVRWGFVPGWVKDPGAFPLVINARAETLTEKPSFRGAIRHGRCLIPATAYAEWSDAPEGGRIRWRIAPAAGGVVAFAGLVETWAGADGSEIDTAAIVTVAAAPNLTAIHDRMPAVIAPADFATWLDVRRVDHRTAERLLRPTAAGEMVATRVETPRHAPPKPPRKGRDRPDDGQLTLI